MRGLDATGPDGGMLVLLSFLGVVGVCMARCWCVSRARERGEYIALPTGPLRGLDLESREVIVAIPCKFLRGAIPASPAMRV